MADVKIIGGGIVGVCSALALQADGHDVEIVEKAMLGGGATFGNCGLLAVGEVVPISRPGVLKKAPKWLLDPQGPLFIRPSAFFSEFGWLARFLLSSRPKRVREIAHAISVLTRRAEGDYRDLLERAGLSNCLVPAENIMVFNSRAAIDKDGFGWDLRRELGFDHEILTRDELRQMEPDLGGPIEAGVLMRNWLHFSDPHLMAKRLASFFEANGGRIRIDEVVSIETGAGLATGLMLGSGDAVAAEWIVLAAGAWSGSLSRQIGVPTPLSALQGYHVHAPTPGIRLSRAALYGEGGFVVTPMETGLRIAGTIEIAGLDPKPDFRRAEVLAKRAKTILPALDLSDSTTWMGPRPFMPDTMPVLGLSPKQKNVVLAYGHAQVGVTLGATTGRLVADLVAGRTPDVDLTPYRPDRFRASFRRASDTPREPSGRRRYRTSSG